jgi:lipopolysaccharide export system protein LptA
MRLPAKELGESTNFAPDRPVNLAGLEQPIEFADVYAEEYTVKANSARFDRRVRIIHPRMNWSCDKLGVDSTGSNGKNVTILAEGAVIFALSGEGRPPIHGTCERAEYLYDLTSDPTIDRMELTGNPVLETTNAIVRNAIIIIDQGKQKAFLPGEYAISGTRNLLGTNGLPSIPK